MSEIEAKDWKVGDIIRVLEPLYRLEAGKEYEIEKIHLYKNGCCFWLKDSNSGSWGAPASQFEFVRRPSDSISPQVAEVKPTKRNLCVTCEEEDADESTTGLWCASCLKKHQDDYKCEMEQFEGTRDKADDEAAKTRERITGSITYIVHHAKIMAEVSKQDALSCIDEQIATLQNLKRELGPKSKGWCPKPEGKVVGRW